MSFLEKLKKAFESEKCEICGEKNSIVHECFCFEKVLGYSLHDEGRKADEKIYMMKMKGLIR